MKSILFVFSILFAMSAQSQNVSIPDPAFKTYLVNNTDININGDSEIQVSEATAFNDSILAYSLNIQDLTGIEAFVNLTFLNVALNQLTTINVSQNTQLLDVICPFNNLSAINVSQNIGLERLVVSMNAGLSILDVSTNVNLRDLMCDNTSISTLNLSNQAALELLDCSNANLTSLNVSACPLLQKLYCEGNSISTLNTGNCVNLWYLSCQGNGISNLDLSSNLALKTVRACCNQMTSINISNLTNLEIFDSPYNNYTALDLSNSPNLNTIYCFSNQLTALNVANGNNTNLQYFVANSNNLDCIQVDNPSYSNANWLPTSNFYNFDSNPNFQVNCGGGVGIPENDLDAFQLFPNPSADAITVVVEKQSTLTIHTLSGAMILQRELMVGTNTIDLTSFGSGVYVTRLTQNGTSFNTKKLVKY
jgi:Leucine-rich repeat (LRR) protein